MSWLGDLLGGGASEIIDSVTDGVDKFITTDEEKQQLEITRQEAKLKIKQLEFEGEKKLYEDRDSARKMYEKDSGLQKVFAMTFLGGYLVITGILVYVVLSWMGRVEIEVPAWAVSLISTVFGAMSSKVNTITDFLFGGSQNERDAQQIQQNLNRQ